VKDALKRVPGVGDVMIFGERKYPCASGLIRCGWLRAVSRPPTWSMRWSSRTSKFPPGQLGQPPSDTKQAFQIPVRVVGRLTSPAEFDNIIVKNSPNGLVLLRDIGHSEVGAEDYSTVLKYSGREAMGIGVMQLSNATPLEVDKNAKAVLAELSKSFPPGLEYAIAFDSTTVVGDSIREVLWTLGLASSSSSPSSSSFCWTGALPSFPPSLFRSR